MMLSANIIVRTYLVGVVGDTTNMAWVGRPTLETKIGGLVIFPSIIMVLFPV